MPRILNDVEHVYFSLEAESHLRDQFELRMLEENRIGGLLRLSVCDDDGKLRLNYDITGLDLLSETVERRKLTSPDLRQLILTLKHVIAGLDPYLLSASGIVLRMDSVYVSPRSGAPCFLFLPGRKSDFSAELSEFLQALLGASDHDDYPSVVLAYRLYKESLDHPSALDRLEQILISQESPDSGPAITRPGGERITVPEMLAEAAQDPCVLEIREAPVGDYGPAYPEPAQERPGLFRRLFRKNSAPETGAPMRAESSEEEQWLDTLVLH